MSTIMISTRNQSTLILTIAGRLQELSPDMLENALQSLRNAERDEAIRSVILCGSGRDFCRGRKTARSSTQMLETASAEMQALAMLVQTLRAYPKPVVAAIEGAAQDAGFALALACDVLIAGQSAQFSCNAMRLGLTPDGGLSWLLMQALPRPLVLELLLESKPVLAARLQQLGVVNQVVEDGKAQQAALRHCQKLAELPPFALEHLKGLVNEAHGSLTAQFAAEQQAHLACLHHHEAAEGLAAFLANRKPRFK